MKRKDPYESEHDLLRKFNAGEGKTFESVYFMHYRPLFHFANRYAKDEQQAEDIIAESFIKCWEKRAEFTSFKGLTAFLYTIVHNACLDHLKKVRRHKASGKEMAHLFGIRELNEPLEAIKSDLIHYSLIEGSALPPQMKKIFELLYIEGFSATEIADKLRLSVHTVRVQKKNALRRIRENLTKKGLLSWIF
jgi:RNA polymerase sigma-70 factor (family 1)